MRPQREVAIEADEEVLAARLDAGDGAADEPGEVGYASHAGLRLRACVGDPPIGQRRTQHIGSPCDGVTFGHGAIVRPAGRYGLGRYTAPAPHDLSYRTALLRS